MHVCNSGRMCKRSHSSWVEFYNKMQVRFHWYFYPNSIVKIGQEVLAWNSLSVDWLEIVIHLFAKKETPFKDQWIKWNGWTQHHFPGRAFGVRFRCRCVQVLIVSRFWETRFRYCSFSFSCVLSIHPQLGFPTSQVEDMTFQISHGAPRTK